jgi:allophanate hydrolase
VTHWIRRLTDAEIPAAGAGPLHGIRFAVKDNIDLAGYPTTAACPDLTTPARANAVAVQRLLDAGAVPVGKTNLDQFATGLVGTRSPYGACHCIASSAHVSGGSSSGSAVAVALGEVPLGLGTDTAGSGRVPAAFNGIVGVKPTRGLVPTGGVLPACRSLDCVTTFTRTVSEARAAFDVLADAHETVGAQRMRVIAVPDGPLDLDPPHAQAWRAALERAAAHGAYLVPVDLSPFLEAARLLYEGPWLAERWSAIGHLLDLPGVDPTVRAVVKPGAEVSGADVFRGLDRLAALKDRADRVWLEADALLLPVTPGHPTLAQVAADPVGVNARLGRYTNFVNLLDQCAVAVPAGERPDGLPFGVQLVAPAYADRPLLDLAASWCGEPVPERALEPGWTELAVCGAHLSGLPLNEQLRRYGGRLRYRARTDGGYRLFALPGPGVPRPGLVRTGDGPAAGILVEVWSLPLQGVAALLGTVPAPLGLGRVTLAGGTEVTGFIAGPEALRGKDVSEHGGWRAYLRATAGMAGQPTPRAGQRGD